MANGRVRQLPIIILALLSSGAPGTFAEEAPLHSQDGASGGESARARDEVWNSPEMLMARSWMKEYFATSKKYSREAGEDYLNELATLDAAEMRVWLAQFQSWRERLAGRHQAWRDTQRRSLQFRGPGSTTQPMLDQQRGVVSGRRRSSEVDTLSRRPGNEQVSLSAAPRPGRSLGVPYSPRVLTPWVGSPAYLPYDLYTPETFEIMQFLNFLDGPTIIRDRR